MRKPYVIPMVVLTLLALGVAACGSSNNTAANAAARKKAFCGANDKIDKAGANVTSAAGFLAVLKANTTALDAMDNNAPAGKVGKDARALVSLARSAVKANNANILISSPNGGDVDTYCGVDGNGDPLPSYFAAGKGSPFCSVSNSIDAGTQNADSASAVLAFLAGHQALINQYATYVPNLPTSIRSDAQTLVTTARAATAANNANQLGTQTVSNASIAVQLYCGKNQ
ncbi:MAG: hypothetical protein P4L20_08355 [Acidimicrobiales bacterium]|nr:hypothetical protein [Acidimicrobiales bacterium]